MQAMKHGGWRPSPDRFIEILDSPRYRRIVDLQDGLLQDSCSFWSDRDVRFMHLPITTNTISSPMGLGSDSEPVEIDLYGERTYLADSMQFMLEYGCRFHEAGAWYLMPSFRGEDADETHLNQFFHSEVEIAGDLEAVMAAAEAYLRAITIGALGRITGSPDVDTAHLDAFLATDRIERIAFEDAYALLRDDPSAVRDQGSWRTITRHGERRLMDEVAPVLWLTNHDHLSVPFYQAYADDQQVAANADLLFGIGEVIGAGERHVDGAGARKALMHHEVDAAPYDWYLTMKDAKPMLTSGFGLGVERWLQWVLSEPDIRELMLVPRLNGVSLAP